MEINLGRVQWLRKSSIFFLQWVTNQKKNKDIPVKKNTEDPLWQMIYQVGADKSFQQKFPSTIGQ